MPLEATPGSASANSYLTVVEADAYHAGRLHADDWTLADDVKKEAALIMATQFIDAMFTPGRYEYELQGNTVRTINAWTGAATTSVQALAWPRKGMTNRNGYPIADTVVPQELKNATAELARQMIASDLTATDDVTAKGITSLSVGSISMSFDKDMMMRFSTVPQYVRALLPPSWIMVVSETPVLRVL